MWQDESDDSSSHGTEEGMKQDDEIEAAQSDSHQDQETREASSEAEPDSDYENPEGWSTVAQLQFIIISID
ncbi:unnamed protein product [Nippostrongylus brasiliensis]|uniref:ARI1B n=1 Tax=Nippostrongylus brasiliensis TaxID=27835 RepID=A0A0N4Y5R3_NIPBR|nr:unnamed protein product [Nippostrongylus brasiliensis]